MSSFRKKPIKLFHIIPFGLVKNISIHKTYLQLIPLFLGFYQLKDIKKSSFLIYPLWALISYGLVLSFWSNDVESGLRLGQFFLLTMFSQYLVINEKFLDVIEFVLKTVVIMSIILFFYEFFMVEARWFSFAGRLRRFGMIMGEPNFSAVLYLGLTMLALQLKKIKIATIFFFLTLPTHSRATLLCLVFLALVLLISKKFGAKILVRINYVLLSLCVCYPIIIFFVYKICNPEFIQKLSRITPRVYLHPNYIEMGLNSIVGVGYFNGINFIKEKLLLSNLNYSRYDFAEQHNIFIQIFSEFGIIGYTIFIYFIWSIFKRINKIDALWTSFFVILLLNFQALNGLHEIILYFFIAYSIFIIEKKPVEVAIST